MSFCLSLFLACEPNALRYKQNFNLGTSAHLIEITETLMNSSAVKEKSALHWAEHTRREGVEEQLELGKKAALERGSNRGSAEEGRQKEILTKPRYTHKSPDTTRLLPVFYRAALRRRNSMTGQFLQRKIWSLSTLPPLAPLSLLFSVYPT